jgi:NADH:ubiquinone oxidoreductase subunit 6 (subunit J)
LNVLQQQKSKFISLNKLPAILLAVLFFVVMLNVILKTDADNVYWVKMVTGANKQIKPNDLMTDNIGINLMTRYLLPFEAISILLMMAMVGAAHLARKEQGIV